jgi:hypothetical protein
MSCALSAQLFLLPLSPSFPHARSPRFTPSPFLRFCLFRSNKADLDYNAVQRGDAEMSQKLWRVVRSCCELGDSNPIVQIHDQVRCKSKGRRQRAHLCMVALRDEDRSTRMRQVANKLPGSSL